MEPFHQDDDFGEIYADVEPPPTATIPDDFCIHHHHHQQQQQTPDPNTDSNDNCNGNCNGDEKLASVSDEKNKNDEVCVGSDSDDDDDDLNIVLNDDDCNGLPPVRAVGSDNVDGGGGDDGGGDQLDNRCESVTKAGVKGGGYGSRFFHRKCTRTRGSVFVNNMKTNVNSIGMASSLNNGRWNGDLSSSHITRMCTTANPMGVQCRYGSVLPWYWSIFDVNMETFPEKLWRVPGADITDYFNFGFNENTWKQYCDSLEQLWKTSGDTNIPDDESLKLNQEAMKEQIDQVVSGSVRSPSSEFEMPKGRAIQVEGSTIERQPSFDIRRPRSRDSDVIIQIKLDSSDDCSGSGNSTVMDASLDGEPIVGNDGNILNSSNEHDDVLSEDQLEDVKTSVGSSSQESTGLVPGVDENDHQDKVDQHSEDATRMPREERKAEDSIGIDTCSADPCWIESELSLGDQELSLTSYSDSDSEAAEDSLHVDNAKSHSPLRRVNSVTSLKESLPLSRKASKSNNFNRKPVNSSYYARNRGSSRKEWRCRSGRQEHGSNPNGRFEIDNEAPSVPMSSGRHQSLLDHQFIDYDICKERQQRQSFAGRKRRDISYNRETKQSYYGSEKVNDNQFQTLQTKYSYQEDQGVFRESTNRCEREHGKGRDYFFGPRSHVEDNEERERDWHHADRGYYDDDLSPRSCWESRQFLLKHSSFPDKERGAYWRRINDKYHCRDRYCNDDFDECEFEFLSESYRMSTSAEREMEFLDNKDEEQFPYVDRDWDRSAHRDGHCDWPPLVLDDSWSWKREDNFQKYARPPNFRHCRQSYRNSVRNYAYGTRGNDKFEVCGRPKRARDNRGSGWFYGYKDAAEKEDFVIDPEEEYQFYGSPSKVKNWTEDEIVCRRFETHTTSLHARVQIDDIKLQQHQLNMPRRSSVNCLKSSSKIMGRGKRWQAVLRCRKSVNLVNGDGKSHTSSRVLCNGKLEYVHQGIAKKQRALVGSNESHEKAIKSSSSKCDRNHESKKLLQNLPDKGHKENSDIEEGQIVTEEPYTEASLSRRDVSEGVVVTESVKKRLSQNDNNPNQLIGGYDSQRILDSLARMEKRRERFKQLISAEKEAEESLKPNNAEESLKPNNDSLVDTGEMKQHRPPRKRRWVGS